MTTQLSPGPWRTTPDAGNWNCSNDDNGSSCYQGIRDADGVVIAIAVAHDPAHWSRPDPEANARLLAAAHDHHAVALELDRLMLVIESAVRWQDPSHSAAVVAMLKANRAAIAKAKGEA